MNLGDGLLFELENGKPRLVLAKYGAEPKSSKSFCQKKSLKVISLKQDLTQPERSEQDKKCKDKTYASYVRQNITHEPKMTKKKGWSESRTSRTDRGHSEKKENDPHKVANHIESLVCLTQEQFQQIQSTINSTTANYPQTHKAEIVDRSDENCYTTTKVEDSPLNGSNQRQRVEEIKKIIKPLQHEQQFGFLSKFGERERERDALEARRTEWRRELDKQMDLKRIQRANVKSNEVSPAGRLKDTMHDWETARAPAEIERLNPKAQIQTQRQLHAAIRSAFIPGEATPMEDAYSDQRAEQKRQWLLELNQQREEVKLRRQREKELNNQAEDIERWAVHFDSLHRATAVPSQQREPELSSCLSHPAVSGALSAAWEGISLLGGESLGRLSVDIVQENLQKTSHLRTMTALLDPAQIEEREHRRLKQLEHQRAVEAQVEERRRQREKEATTHRAHEEEEERRVEMERERLQQQFLKDTERQRHREEMQSRKTEDLYLSIQRAQEKAFKDKHLQKIKDLAKKGHDVSKLLHSLEGDSVSQAFRGYDSSVRSASLISSEVHIQTMEPSTSTSPRKDTAVQTVTYMDAPNTVTSKISRCSVEKLLEKSHCNLPTDAEADPYEPYARTDKNRKQQLGKNPEWNTQRPSKAFVPASERYPEALQRHRQQSRKHRQLELMTLMEKNNVSRKTQQGPLPPSNKNNHRSTAQRCNNPAQKQSETQMQESAFDAERRVFSPVAAMSAEDGSSLQHTSQLMMENTGRPLSSDYVPYIRTEEVYHMDPMAPLSRPSTYETQQTVDKVRSRQATTLVQHDPLHPKSTERQQAILKGLFELRQGLLMKQKELETSLKSLH